MTKKQRSPFVKMAAAAGITSLMLGGLRLLSGRKRRLEVVPHVDLSRYVGKWYEIARIPNWFERRCVAATAQYTLNPDGTVMVQNACRLEGFGGRLRTIRGVARVVDPATNARLKVSFFRPFSGDYWIIDLDPEYRWVAVGEPRRRYLWILSRTPTLDEETLQGILGRVAGQGYDLSRVVRTPQPTAAWSGWLAGAPGTEPAGPGIDEGLPAGP
jgi:apolipoprotein D and lipocalin family protein